MGFLTRIQPGRQYLSNMFVWTHLELEMKVKTQWGLSNTSFGVKNKSPVFDVGVSLWFSGILSQKPKRKVSRMICPWPWDTIHKLHDTFCLSSNSSKFWKILKSLAKVTKAFLKHAKHSVKGAAAAVAMKFTQKRRKIRKIETSHFSPGLWISSTAGHHKRNPCRAECPWTATWRD